MLIEEVKTILDKITEIGEHINSTRLLNDINYAKTGLVQTDKLRLTIIGQHSNGLPQILSNIIEKPELFSKPLLVRYKGYILNAKFSESDQYKISKNDGEVISQTKDAFEDNFYKLDADYLKGEIYTNSEVLKLMDINLICTLEDFNDFNWITNFSQSDYVVIVLDALKLFSNSERVFIRETIKRYFDLDRCALLINNFGFVEECDKEDILSYIKTFISSLGTDIPYYMRSNTDYNPKDDKTEHSYAQFEKFIKDEIHSSFTTLREKSLIKTADICIESLLESIEKTKEELKIDSKKIEAVINELNAKDKYIQDRIASAERKIQLYIDGLVKVNLKEDINKFNLKLKQDIQNEVMKCKSIEDIKDIKDNISDYIQYTWEQFFINKQAKLEEDFVCEMRQILEAIESDIEEYLKDVDDDSSTAPVTHTLLIDIINEYFNQDYNLRALINEKRTKNQVSDLTRYMNIGAIGLAFINLPLAVITFGSAQLLKFAFKESDLKLEKTAMIEAINEGCDKMKNMVLENIDNQFSELSENLKKQVRSIYEKIISLLISTLEEKKKAAENSQEMLVYLNNIENVVIPNLKSINK